MKIEKTKEWVRDLLRPMKGKVVLIIVIFLVSVFLLFFYKTFYIFDFGAFQNPIISVPLFFVILPIVAFMVAIGIYPIEPFLNKAFTLTLFAVLFVLQIFYWYLLSCIIIYLTKKVRIKK